MKKMKVQKFIWRTIAIAEGATLLSLHWNETWTWVWNTVKGFFGG